MMVKALRSATVQKKLVSKPLVESQSNTMELSSAPANNVASSSPVAAGTIMARSAIDANGASNLIFHTLAMPATYVVADANRVSSEPPLVCEVRVSQIELIRGAVSHVTHATRRGRPDSRGPLRHTNDRTQSPQRTLNTLFQSASRSDELSLPDES